MSSKPLELCPKCAHFAEAYFRAHGTMERLPVIVSCYKCFNKHLLQLLEEALPYTDQFLMATDLTRNIQEALVASVMEE
jgi:hypothetical protein